MATQSSRTHLMHVAPVVREPHAIVSGRLSVGRIDVVEPVVHHPIHKIVLLLEINFGEERDDDRNEAIRIVLAHRRNCSRGLVRGERASW